MKFYLPSVTFKFQKLLSNLFLFEKFLHNLFPFWWKILFHPKSLQILIIPAFPYLFFKKKKQRKEKSFPKYFLFFILNLDPNVSLLLIAFMIQTFFSTKKYCHCHQIPLKPAINNSCNYRNTIIPLQRASSLSISASFQKHQ